MTIMEQCDGQRPTCGRCQGYGYNCQWAQKRRRQHGIEEPCVQRWMSAQKTEDVRALRNTVQAYESLLRRLKEKLNSDEQALIDAAFADTRNDERLAPAPSGSLLNCSRLLLQRSIRRPSHSSRRYLGKVSDVSFFNSVRDLLLRGQNGLMDSYERETIDALDVSEGQNDTELPGRASADTFVDIYFTTIHVAYPFIYRKQFLEDYCAFWERPPPSEPSPIFRALLCKPRCLVRPCCKINADLLSHHICHRLLLSTLLGVSRRARGIHACSKCPRRSATSESILDSDRWKTQVYFRSALSYACRSDTERSIENVCLLLAQCFYLLATCQTDRYSESTTVLRAGADWRLDAGQRWALPFESGRASACMLRKHTPKAQRTMITLLANSDDGYGTPHTYLTVSSPSNSDDLQRFEVGIAASGSLLGPVMNSSIWSEMRDHLFQSLKQSLETISLQSSSSPG